jgi:membrane protease YdiL (CAAX protease family)
LRGLGLALVAWLAYLATWVATWAVTPAVIRAAVDAASGIGGRPAWWAVLLTSLANPVAEEFLYLAFIARVLELESAALALSASTIARVLAHTYQGPFALVSILPLGLIFGAYYLRSHRIWPIVAAHAGMDILALGRLAGAA